ncbi:MAG: AMP-binding protein [Antarcticimicrobium sp.]|uniref:class I adenylate-forming enzyme family protein n=1 Tax=Antarcticimicrobium sp. TaxID=2824147 RepID=UPI002635C31F|nr:AMP-binding protein [Antarcticimicrobium sp.]MDF1718352.1 AMP-binding protein [Antarcticimicrobium sp.]
MTATSLAYCLETAATLLRDRPFLITESGETTFGEFDALSGRLANVLLAYGIGRGDVVGLYLPSCPFLSAGYFACQKIGAIAAPISSLTRAQEVRALLERTQMLVMVVDTQTAAEAVRACQAAAHEVTILVSGGTVAGAVPLDAAVASASVECPPLPLRPDDPAALFFTSGTTGAPKGAVQTQRSITTTVRDMAVHAGFSWDREVFLCALPVFNNFGATVMVNGAIYNGARVVMLERWDTQKVLDEITRHRVTFMAGAPTMFLYMLSEFDPSRHDLSSMRLAVAAGAPVSPEILTRFQEVTGVPILELYGATEVSGGATAQPLVGVRKRGSAGVPLGNSRIAIVDEDGAPVPVGETGEVRISGDIVGAGYWGDKETTAASFSEAGWLSGDIGYLDEDGYLFIVDRKKDVIIAGGFNIYPIEVEDLLFSHPDVGVCAVIGVPDKVKGEIPAAVLIPRADRSLDPAALIDFCRENLAAYKVPRRLFTVDEMPHGPTGKILKRTLRDWLAEGRLTEVTP